MPEPPKTRALRLSRNRPFVEVVETEETKGTHALWALVGGFGALAMLAAPNGVAAFAAPLAFISGYAVHSYIIHDEYYDRGGDA